MHALPAVVQIIRAKAPQKNIMSLFKIRSILAFEIASGGTA